jgi:aspartate/methionine/tyrosine aminotransferase
MISPPDFRLEVYLGRWEFAAAHHLTASDAETLTVRELLDLGTDADRAAFDGLALRYVETWGGRELREAVAAGYDHCGPEHVLCFSGAEEAMFWALQEVVGPDDHAVVLLPCYQSAESIPVATGADVTGVPLEPDGGGWRLDLDAVRRALRAETRLVAVNFPNNPTGHVPDPATFRALAELCDAEGIRLFSDEVYRGLELDPARTLPQAADLSPAALSVGVMSKAYGLPGLRVGWLACRDRALLERLERRKHYTSICNAGPSELLATIALKAGERIKARNRAIIEANLPVFGDFFARHDGLFEWRPPDGGCVAFPRYLGADGVETMVRRAVEDEGVVLLPSSIYRSDLGEVPDDHFRIGVGRRDPEPGLAAWERSLKRVGS